MITIHNAIAVVALLLALVLGVVLGALWMRQKNRAEVKREISQIETNISDVNMLAGDITTDAPQKEQPSATKAEPLEPELEADLRSTSLYVRVAAVRELGNILNGINLGKALSAEQALKRVAENDASRSIASLAGQLLKEYQVKKEIKPESARKGTIRVGNISSVGEINIAGGNIVAGNVEKRLAGDSTIDTPPPEDKKKKGN